MTIAAGFIYQDGVLLCADTQISSWALKLNGSKIAYFICPAGIVSFACAGNAAYAISAIQKCRRHLDNASENINLRDEIEAVLDSEYQRTVWAHPCVATDPTLHYWILAAIRPKHGMAELFVSSQNSIRDVDGYDCIGAGDLLAQSLIRPLFQRNLPERVMLPLAAYVLGVTKRYVDGCGGMSQFVAIGNDGIVKRVVSRNTTVPLNHVEWVEAFASDFDVKSRRLMFISTDPETSDEDFETRLSEFNLALRDARENWRQKIKGGMSIVGWQIAAKQSDQPYPQSTTGDP